MMVDLNHLFSWNELLKKTLNLVKKMILKYYIKQIKEKYKLNKANDLWRKTNKHNFTFVARYNSIPYILVGKKTYGTIDAIVANKTNKLIIGDFCSIADGVLFIVSAEHNANAISTYPFKTFYGIDSYEGKSKGDIVIEDDVWIGANSIILSGVRIGKGAIIGAGSVVTKDVQEYSIVCGNPAKLIRYRFNEDKIRKLRKINYKDLNDDVIRDNIDLLYDDITENNIDNVLNLFIKNSDITK